MSNSDFEIYMPGMFSKAGKFTQQKYIVFQRQKQAFHDQNEQNHKINNKQMNEHHLSNKKQPELQKIKKYGNNHSNIKNHENKHHKKQPFQIITSRENAQYLKQVKNPPPPCGHYHPKFNEIDKKVHHYDMFYDTIKTDTRKTVEKLGNYEREMTVLAEKSPSKVYGRIHFPHFTSRKKYLSVQEAHEKRFELYQDTFYNSRNLRPQNVLINKNLGREDFEHLNKKNSCPDYDKNYNMILKKTVLMVPLLKLTTARKSMDKVQACTNENFFDYGQFTPREQTQIFKNTKKVDFDKQLSRYTNEKSPIPSFMQKNMAARQSLNQINQKMLESNSFAASKFQTVQTSFQRNNPKTLRTQTDIDQTLQTLYSIE